MEKYKTLEVAKLIWSKLWVERASSLRKNEFDLLVDGQYLRCVLCFFLPNIDTNL